MKDAHGQLLAAVNALQARVEDVEIKGWKLAVALALGAGGTAGVLELVNGLLGG